MSEFSKRIDDQLNRSQEARKSQAYYDAHREQAISAAKNSIYGSLLAEAAEAAKELRARNVTPEVHKQFIEDIVQKKRFLSSSVVQKPVFGEPAKGWILVKRTQFDESGGDPKQHIPSHEVGMILGQSGQLYTFKDDIAKLASSFDDAYAATFVTPPSTLEQVEGMSAQWSEMIFATTLRAIKGDRYN